MRVDWFHVRAFKNLRDFTIDLEEHEAMSVLIGENGSGKSNLFEAIVQVFRALDLGEGAPFAYVIRYVCRGHKVKVTSDPAREEDRGYVFEVDGASLSWSAFKRRGDELLPAHVFAYYSGPGMRLERLFRRHLIEFDSRVRRGKESVGQLRRLFYCLPRHSRFVLLSYFIDPSTEKRFLAEYFGIEGFDSALIVLRKPWWDATKKARAEGRDLRFWGALGDVSRFLDATWQHSLAPMRVTELREESGVPGERSEEEERLYLYLQDEAHLHELAKSWSSPKEFFAALDAVDIADLVSDVRIRVRCAGGEVVTFSELSEGEQQLLTVVGMLRFTQGEETLFLLDEPDTHLNPRWKLDYLDLLEREVGGVKGSSQLILSTHDPLTIAALKRKQVQIFHRDEKTRAVKVQEAPDDPRGMGVVGVLTQMFGLPRTLDKPTLDMIRERDELARMEPRSQAQGERLTALNDALGALGFMFESRDPRVDKVLREIGAWERESNRLFWNLSESEQRLLAERMVRKLLGEPTPEGAL